MFRKSSARTELDAAKVEANESGIFALLVQDYLKEKRARRRWRLIIGALIFLYLVGVLYAVLQTSDGLNLSPHTALVDLNGLIAPQETNADSIYTHLKRAFEAEKSKGVILRVNSQGGTPVQAAEINRGIARLRQQHPDKPFYVVIADVCASGCYYVAVAADTIYAHPASLIGSIGVRMGGFGFVDAMRKLGVERRLITAGEHKGLLDPFLPLDESDQRHAKALLTEVHNQFIAAVKAGRGDRLTTEQDVFSGLIWSGQSARELGLIDAFGSVGEIAREQIGAEQVVDYTPTAWHELSKQLGITLGTALSRSFQAALDTLDSTPTRLH